MFSRCPLTHPSPIVLCFHTCRTRMPRNSSLSVFRARRALLFFDSPPNFVSANSHGHKFARFIFSRRQICALSCFSFMLKVFGFRLFLFAPNCPLEKPTWLTNVKMYGTTLNVNAQKLSWRHKGECKMHYALKFLSAWEGRGWEEKRQSAAFLASLSTKVESNHIFKTFDAL